ncbi:hypothetical protein GCK72_017745 [Caenorhabditis remanei]|uniref:Ground-like domain-containing protein n=1 Tax=Caenorhabditis remanei TaxID=31234 RepID=A0A6A5G8U3_CAERE|nr:hypothetical protein GCK72_017745 [Caenorhabditis remanei]KAF1751191.1 hypothetical protein GCK72_017745 [Caenorhabditis remanei]
MNCQCQSSCNSPPSQLGCLCPPPMPCYQQQPAQTFYTQPAPPVIYQPYQNQQQQQRPSSYLANIPPYMQPYAQQPTFFSTPPPIQVHQLPPGTPSLSYPSSSQMFIAEQSSINSQYSPAGSPGPSTSDSQDKLNLQPPALKQKEETFENHVNEKSRTYETDRPLSDIFYETNTGEDDNEIDRNYSPIQTTTENVYRNTDTTTRKNYESSTWPTSTIAVTTKRYETELKRGEGSSDISMSGYGFDSGSTSAPIMLEFLEHPRQYENRSPATPNNTDNTDVTDFTQEVDAFYKSSTSHPIQTFEYGAVRDARDSSDNRETSTPKFPFDRDEEVKPKNKWTSKRKIREKEDSSKCNNPILKDLMEMKMTASPSISKQMIYSAATEMWVGRNVNVICSKHSFSYVVVTSPIFCEHRKKALTCFVFFQP